MIAYQIDAISEHSCLTNQYLSDVSIFARTVTNTVTSKESDFRFQSDTSVVVLIVLVLNFVLSAPYVRFHVFN